MIIVLVAGSVFGAPEVASKNSDVVKKAPDAKIKAEVVMDPFAVPAFMQHDVDFWAKVYREWDTNQVVIYDSPSKVVFSVVSLPHLGFDLSGVKYRKDVDAEVKRVQDIIKRIQNGDVASTDPKFISLYETLKKHDLIKETDLLDRMRRQNGLRTQFERGLKISGRYADDMKAVLRWQQLSDEVLALAFVESLFNITAVSHAGACGPWGIMKETAISMGIYVNKFTDERIDPVVATLGASRYLKKAKENLSEWSLTFTSYNYGYPGMLRAKEKLGKDFKRILEEHDGGAFGYASKNYFAEVLAAIDTLRNQEIYFPGLKKDSRWEYEMVQVQRPVLVEDLVASGALTREAVMTLNPALTKHTITGHEVIPADYALRVPKGGGSKFYAAIKKIPTSKRDAAGLKVSTKYNARGKVTLNGIAKLFGVKADSLAERMGKPGDYRPKGPVIIRSGLHGYSPMLEINKSILATLSAGQALENPPQIKAAQGAPR